MLTQDEFQGTVKHLTGEELGLRVGALKDLWQFPSADARILPYLERLLHDKTPCVLGHPYVFGEIKWLAAHALAAERGALGITQRVYLPSVVRPAETRDLILAEHQAGIKPRGGVEGLLENMALLRDMGHMPMVALTLVPPVAKSSHMEEQVLDEVVIKPVRLMPELVPA